MLNKIETNAFGLNIELKELGKINYLIGRNGQGKSRLLNALIKKFGANASQLLVKDTETSIYPEQIKGVAEPINFSPTSPILNPEELDNSLIVMSQNPIKKDQITEITTKSRSDRKNEEKTLSIIPDYKHNEVEIPENQSNFWSTGTSSFTKFKENLKKQISTRGENLNRNSKNEDLIIIIIEDIERYLHPSVQKLLQNEIEKIITESIFKDQIQVFITTHSPFVISGIKNSISTTKVYLIDQNQTIDLFGKHNSENSKNGYSSQQSLLMANYLLGSGLDDFFPETIYLCENSISVLIQGISSKLKIPFNSYCLHTSGDSDTITKSSNSMAIIEMIINTYSSQVLKFMLNVNIVALFDGPLTFKEEKKLTEIKYKNFSHTLLSSKSELEQEYPISIVNELLIQKKMKTWDTSNTVKFKDHLLSLGVNGKNIGKLKEELAKYVVSKINTSEELKTQLPLIYNLLLPNN